MIVSRTPFRLTLGGGGSDLPAFYERHGGYILALGIDKYMYVALNVPWADRKVRLHYTQSEMTDRVADLRHDLAREALLAHGIEDAIEVASLADLPAGTGLGSSSCYLVGLLNAIPDLLGASSFFPRPSTRGMRDRAGCLEEAHRKARPIHGRSRRSHGTAHRSRWNSESRAPSASWLCSRGARRKDAPVLHQRSARHNGDFGRAKS